MGKLLGVKAWLALSGVLVFAAGASIGFLASNLLDDRDDSFPEPQPAAQIHIIDNTTVYNELKLTAAQRQKADAILSAHFQEMRRLRRELDGLGAKMEKDLLDILDAGQQERMREIMRQLKLPDVAGRVSSTLAWYRREMGLTQQQEESLYPIFLAHQIEVDEHFRAASAKRARGETVDRKQVLADVSKKADEIAVKVQAFLTPEQMTKFRELEKRRMGWFGRGPHGERKDGERKEGEKSASRTAAPAPPAAAPAPPPPVPAP